MKRLHLAAAALSLFAAGAQAEETVKVGLVTTLSGAQSVMGVPMRDSATLALEMLGGKLGGLPGQLIFADDQQKPDVERQIADRFVKQDKVDFVTGLLASNGLLAIVQPLTRSKTILISANAGPHELAGAQCTPYFFSVSQENDEPAQAMGAYLTEQKIDDVYIMAPNYAAGKDMLAGFKSTFKGHVVGEAYTAFGQLDYQAEISQIQAANPKAVFVFYPGGMGIQFTKQYAQSGLRAHIPMYSVNTVDGSSLPTLQDAADGAYEATDWASTIDNPRNRMFVDAFRKRFGYVPAGYAARSFDAMFLIDSAVLAVGGNLSDKPALIAALAKADFPSVKGRFAFNTNHYPIQDFYIVRAGKQDGDWVLQTQKTIFTDYHDSFAPECTMKPAG